MAFVFTDEETKGAMFNLTADRENCNPVLAF